MRLIGDAIIQDTSLLVSSKLREFCVKSLKLASEPFQITTELFIRTMTESLRVKYEILFLKLHSTLTELALIILSEDKNP